MAALAIQRLSLGELLCWYADGVRVGMIIVFVAVIVKNY